MGFLQIQVKYFDKFMPKLEKISKGDWIDLRNSEEVTLKAGEFKLIPLGIGMKLPPGYEAITAPRGSSFKKYNFLQCNSIGVIDSSFCGDDDQWHLPVLPMKDIVIPKYERICQFRIQQTMPHIDIVEVNTLLDPSRGGYGSTGYK